MRQPGLPMSGSCRCGQVAIRVTAPPLLTAACHCTGCQRVSASAFSLSVAIPADGFEIIDGDPVRGGLHGDEARHFHCPHCMSWMFTLARQGEGSFVNLRPTILDDVTWFEPFIESYTSEKLPWATSPAKHAYERFPPPDAYEALMAGYGKHVGRDQ